MATPAPDAVKRLVDRFDQKREVSSSANKKNSNRAQPKTCPDGAHEGHVKTLLDKALYRATISQSAATGAAQQGSGPHLRSALVKSRRDARNGNRHIRHLFSGFDPVSSLGFATLGRQRRSDGSK